MQGLANLLDEVYRRLSELRANNEYRKCLSCECYFGLLYLMKEELSRIEGPGCEGMLDELSHAFDERNEVKMHGCLGCEECPPAEWTTQLLGGLKR